MSDIATTEEQLPDLPDTLDVASQLQWTPLCRKNELDVQWRKTNQGAAVGCQCAGGTSLLD